MARHSTEGPSDQMPDSFSKGRAIDARTHTSVSTFNKFLAALVILGALNWGFVGFFQGNLVAALFGGDTRLNPSFLS
jgi:hypothetical protein